MKNQQLGGRIVSVARLHFVYAGLIALSTIFFDAWDLITPETIIDRWMMASAIGVVAAVVWYMAKVRTKAKLYYHFLVYGLIITDITIATTSVLMQRGIASKAVMLYVIPLFVSVILRSRTAVISTAIACLATYSAACVSYFYENPGQAYKIELYGEILQQGGLIIIIALLLSLVVFDFKKS